MQIGQVLHDRPLQLHCHVVFVREQPRDVAARHFLVDQQTLRGTVRGKCFYEQLLYVGLPHALQSQLDFVRFLLENRIL